MGIAKLNSLTIPLFTLGAIGLLLVGSFFSFGVLRLFQKRYVQGTISMLIAVVSFVALLMYVD